MRCYCDAFWRISLPFSWVNFAELKTSCAKRTMKRLAKMILLAFLMFGSISAIRFVPRGKQNFKNRSKNTKKFSYFERWIRNFGPGHWTSSWRFSGQFCPTDYWGQFFNSGQFLVQFFPFFLVNFAPLFIQNWIQFLLLFQSCFIFDPLFTDVSVSTRLKNGRICLLFLSILSFLGFCFVHFYSLLFYQLTTEVRVSVSVFVLIWSVPRFNFVNQNCSLAWFLSIHCRLLTVFRPAVFSLKNLLFFYQTFYEFLNNWEAHYSVFVLFWLTALPEK